MTCKKRKSEYCDPSKLLAQSLTWRFLSANMSTHCIVARPTIPVILLQQDAIEHYISKMRQTKGSRLPIYVFLFASSWNRFEHFAPVGLHMSYSKTMLSKKTRNFPPLTLHALSVLLVSCRWASMVLNQWASNAVAKDLIKYRSRSSKSEAILHCQPEHSNRVIN